MADFDWKKNSKWIALGVGILIVIIGIVATVLILTMAPTAAEVKDKAGDGKGTGGGGGGKSGGGGFSQKTDTKSKAEYHLTALNYQNARRREHHTNPLELDNELNGLADKCAKYYALEVGIIDHSCKMKGDAGENLYQRSAGDLDLPALVEDASQHWYEEIKNYDFANPGFNATTGHFTAMIWKNAKKLGVGVYKSDKISVVVTLYTPQPNIVGPGMFEGNVLPK